MQRFDDKKRQALRKHSLREEKKKKLKKEGTEEARKKKPGFPRGRKVLRASNGSNCIEIHFFVGHVRSVARLVTKKRSRLVSKGKKLQGVS